MASKQNQGNKGAARKSTPRKGGRPGQNAPPPPPPPSSYPGGSGGGGSTNAEAEPPIIVQGGSVTIRSQEFLSVNYDEADKKWVYKTDKIKVKKIKTKGKTPQEDEPKADGTFEIEFYT